MHFQVLVLKGDMKNKLFWVLGDIVKRVVKIGENLVILMNIHQLLTKRYYPCA